MMKRKILIILASFALIASIAGPALADPQCIPGTQTCYSLGAGMPQHCSCITYTPSGGSTDGGSTTGGVVLDGGAGGKFPPEKRKVKLM